VATIVAGHAGAIAQTLDTGDGEPRPHVYAVLPAAPGDDCAAATQTAGRVLAERLRSHAIVALSSFHADPAELGEAMREAELVLEVLRHSERPVVDEIGSGTYRLLFRMIASHPEEIRAFYETTVAPLVRYDDQYNTELVRTLHAYLDANCNMNATAAAIFAHRHTVAYRLDRMQELTGLDPTLCEHRERLGIGLKIHRIVAPRPVTLPARG
jgi:DNA-binding PucR family transcriptional regulator